MTEYNITHEEEMQQMKQKGEYCGTCQNATCLVDTGDACCHTQVRFGSCHHNFVSAFPQNEESVQDEMMVQTFIRLILSFAQEHQNRRPTVEDMQELLQAKEQKFSVSEIKKYGQNALERIAKGQI